jgi:hypothetical protein
VPRYSACHRNWWHATKGRFRCDICLCYCFCRRSVKYHSSVVRDPGSHQEACRLISIKMRAASTVTTFFTNRIVSNFLRGSCWKIKGKQTFWPGLQLMNGSFRRTAHHTWTDCCVLTRSSRAHDEGRTSVNGLIDRHSSLLPLTAASGSRIINITRIVATVDGSFIKKSHTTPVHHLGRRRNYYQQTGRLF